MAVCDPNTAGIDYLMNWEFVKAITCTYANVTGLLVMGTFVYTAIAGSIYIRTGSVVIPFGLLLLTGGAVMSQVAGIAVGMAAIVALLTGAAIVTALYVKFSR